MHYVHEDNFKGFVTRFKPHAGYSKGFEKIKALGYEFGLFNSVFSCKALPFLHACKCIRVMQIGLGGLKLDLSPIRALQGVCKKLKHEVTNLGSSTL